MRVLNYEWMRGCTEFYRVFLFKWFEEWTEWATIAVRPRNAYCFVLPSFFQPSFSLPHGNRLFYLVLPSFRQPEGRFWSISSFVSNFKQRPSLAIECIDAGLKFWMNEILPSFTEFFYSNGLKKSFKMDFNYGKWPLNSVYLVLPSYYFQWHRGVNGKGLL